MFELLLEMVHLVPIFGQLLGIGWEGGERKARGVI